MRWLSSKELAYVTSASILLAFFIISLGQLDSIVAVITHPAFPADLLAVTLIHFVVLVYILLVHKYLEQSFSFTIHIKQRLIRQVFWGWVLPCLLSLALGYGYLHFVLGYRVSETSFYYYEYPIGTVLIASINLVLIILSLITGPSGKSLTGHQEKKSTLLLSKGDRTVPLPVVEIACIQKEGEFNFVHTFDGRQFVISESLDDTFHSLDDGIFFRANRQSIIHRNTCGSYQANRSGKISLTLSFPPGKEISISQKRAQEFKIWLKAN